MNKLPYWHLVNPLPSFHDVESGTVVEMTAKVYGAMNDLINEYNSFVEKTNAEIEKYGSASIEEQSEFYQKLVKSNREFFQCIRTYVEEKLLNIQFELEDIAAAWLEDHPEATTTVQDGSLTESKFSNELKLKSIKDYVTPQMYGAKADGVTDDSDAIQACVNANRNIYIPRGEYYCSKSINLTNESTYIFGEDNMSWEKTIFMFDNSHGFIINGAKYSTINGVSVGIKSTDNDFCGFLFEGEHVHKFHLENCMIKNFKYGISECLSESNTATTLWNCSFKHIRTDNTYYAIYFSQNTTTNNNFGVIFEDFFADNGRVYMCTGKYTFIGCNFGIRTSNYLNMKNNCYVDFTNCNFECDEYINSGYCLYFNGKEYVFTNCQFNANGADGMTFIQIESDLQRMKFVSCHSKCLGESSIWGTHAECAPGAIRIEGNGMQAPAFSGSAYTLGYNNNDGDGLISVYDNVASRLKDNTLYFNPVRKRVEYYKDDNQLDSNGNEIKAQYPINIGGALYLDGGSIDVTGDMVIVRYNRQKKGAVIIDNPPIIDNVPIKVCRDVSDTYKDRNDLAVYRVKMWDSSSNTWVSNTKSFVLTWIKISD